MEGIIGQICALNWIWKPIRDPCQTCIMLSGAWGMHFEPTILFEYSLRETPTWAKLICFEPFFLFVWMTFSCNISHCWMCSLWIYQIFVKSSQLTIISPFCAGEIVLYCNCPVTSIDGGEDNSVVFIKLILLIFVNNYTLTTFKWKHSLWTPYRFFRWMVKLGGMER